MRIRSIKPEFWEDEALAALPPHDRLLFIACWQLADRNGIFERREAWIKAKVFPYETGETTDVSQMLHRLTSGNFLSAYSVQGKDYLQVRNFSRHQRITGKEAMSKGYHPLPALVAGAETTGKQPGNSGATTEIVREQGAGSREQGAMPGGAGRVSYPPEPDPNLIQTRAEPQEPVGAGIPKIEALHKLWQELTGQTARLDMEGQRLWFYWQQEGFTADQLATVVRYLRPRIKDGRRNDGALKLCNLLDVARFNADLGLATAKKPATKPIPAPAKPIGPVMSDEQLRECARKLAEQRKAICT